MEKKVCCIFNYAPHYRTEIYKKMSEEFECDFFFGTSGDGKIEKMDYVLITTNVKELSTIKLFRSINWISNSINLCFQKYKNYIITGEPHCLSSWVILLINRLLGKRTYLWTHGWYGNESVGKKILKKLYFTLGSKILLYGNYAKELMIKEGFDPRKLVVVYNSLNYDDQINIRQRLTNTNIFKRLFGNDYPVVTFTGRLTKEKKLELLIKSLKILLDRSVNLNVLILGEGKEGDKLVDMVEELGIKNHVYFYGACYEEEVIAEIYFNSACCVSPGNVGLTGIHAMTYGCPVISHNNFSEQMPEFEIIVNGVTGFFYQQGDVSDLAKKIENILSGNRSVFQTNCVNEVDRYYNTNAQILTLRQLLNG
ncbi:glycosyltransferase [Sphingobacterium sp. DN00404]|uniref:Glycosyltransferase n=1 Tax=Sphingobacterium micropteri TaxID=2763501 RepID=A0ABR7YKV3_9SPHI|nr:glycosyltransferase [Sphingobacterium micropteri]MBD1431818.1 glycosyltransferase [Sphingobacterium micropteri]